MAEAARVQLRTDERGGVSEELRSSSGVVGGEGVGGNIIARRGEIAVGVKRRVCDDGILGLIIEPRVGHLGVEYSGIPRGVGREVHVGKGTEFVLSRRTDPEIR